MGGQGIRKQHEEELTQLLTHLAFHLHFKTSTSAAAETPTSAAAETHCADFNRSLNFNFIDEQQEESTSSSSSSGLRVLDTALSLMCFKLPQVCDSMVESLVPTIVSALSSSISCKISRFPKNKEDKVEELLQIGTFISADVCIQLIQLLLPLHASPSSLTLFGSGGHGKMLSQQMLPAVLRAAISCNYYQSLPSETPVLWLQPQYQKNTVTSKLHSLFSEEISVNNMRLFLWYLDPLTLKHDISKILWEFVRRPFLCLKKELHDRMTWRSIVICLVLSPTMFVETTTLLHNWYFWSGLESILELQIQLVLAVLDVLSQPMWWTMSVEGGSKLPFSNAYFPDDHDLVRTLAGPVSYRSLFGLFHHVRGAVSFPEKDSFPKFQQILLWERMIDHKYNWAMLMAFPSWFFFSAVLLFFSKSCQDAFLSNCIPGTLEMEKTYNADEISAAAASYLACTIGPISEDHFNLLVDCLTKISDSWVGKQSGLAMQNCSSGFGKKFGRINARDNEKDKMGRKKNGQTVRLWLKEYQNCHARYWNEVVNRFKYTASKGQNFLGQRQKLFRRIPLGVFIGCSDIDDEGCELLLHYAATGAILNSTGECVELKQARENPNDFMSLSEESDPVTGACTVFHIFEAIEDMTSSIFETEDSRLKFVCQLKIKAVGFLVKCIRRLLQLDIDKEEGKTRLIDLRSRLIQWRHQGEEVFQGSVSLEDVLSDLNYKIDSI